MRASRQVEAAVLAIFVAASIASSVAVADASPTGAAPIGQATVAERPAYPLVLRRTGISGKVVAHVYVEPSGDVTRVEILSSPHELMSEEVVAKVKKWKYSPQPKSFIAEYVFEFSEQAPR